MDECKNTPRCDLMRTPNHKLCSYCAGLLLGNRKMRLKRARHVRYIHTSQEGQRGEG